jgi:hypothetical protein
MANGYIRVKFLTSNLNRLTADQIIVTHSDVDHASWHHYIKRAGILHDAGRNDLLRVPHHGSQPEVPWVGECILEYVCSSDRLEVVLGDLERNFRRRTAKRGLAAARRWYWWQVMRSVAAFGIQAIVAIVLLRDFLKKIGL